MAGQGGSLRGQSKLALMYANGFGVPRDSVKAMDLWRQGAEKGYPLSQYNLGVMYDRGEDAAQNPVEAAKWFRMAAEQDQPLAQYELGRSYMSGRGVQQDYAEAMNWFKKVAVTGYPEADYHIGMMYEAGEGVPQDNAEARKWLQMAADQDHAGAKVALGILERSETETASPPAANASPFFIDSEMPPQPKQVSSKNSGSALQATSPAAFNEQLDALLTARDWNGLRTVLSQPQDDETLLRSMDWLQAKINAGGGFFLSFIYQDDLWILGSRQNVTDPDNDMRVKAAVIMLYSYELISIDGAICEDQTAPANRTMQLFSRSLPLLSYIQTLPGQTRIKMVDEVVALEAQTAPLRTNDDLLCRDGMEQMKAGLERGKEHEATAQPGYVGKVVQVEAPADWIPKFLPPETYKPIQAKAREDIKKDLLQLINK